MKYEELFTDKSQSEVDEDRLEAYVRYYHRLDATEKAEPLEKLVTRGTQGAMAVDALIDLLNRAYDDWASEEPWTATDDVVGSCCRTLVQWFEEASVETGVEIRQYYNRGRPYKTIKWGLLARDSCTASIAEVLEAVSEGEDWIPPWYPAEAYLYAENPNMEGTAFARWVDYSQVPEDHPALAGESKEGQQSFDPKPR